MICDKIFYMTFNDLRKNAYKCEKSLQASDTNVFQCPKDVYIFIAISCDFMFFMFFRYQNMI